MSACRGAPGAIALVLLGLLAGACGHHSVAPTAPPAVPPDASWIADVSPEPRSTGVLYDVVARVRFARDMDPASLTTNTVFLKLDTARVPITLAWDDAARELSIRAQVQLQLRRTYTVILAGAIRDRNGQSMGTAWHWQFTTNSVRRVQAPSPMTGAAGESPFVTLRWSGLTEATAGAVEYTVRAAGDSLGAQTASIIGVATDDHLLPDARWSQDAAVWWSVEAHNLDTDERLRGPSWQFECLPTDTPADTMIVPYVYWACRDIFGRGSCQGDSIVCGSQSNGYFMWTLGAADSTVRLAGATIVAGVFAYDQYLMGPDVTALGWAGPLVDCVSMRCPGPPWKDDAVGVLAHGEALAGGVRLRSDRLTAHFESLYRQGDTCAVFLDHPGRVAFRAPWSSVFPTQLKLLVYRRGPAPVRAGSTILSLRRSRRRP